MKIMHVINSLNKGGAEGNLYRLCKFHKQKYKNNIDISILTLISNGFYETELKKLGIKIFSLNLSKHYMFFKFIKKILILRKFYKVGCITPILLHYSYKGNFIVNYFGIFVTQS